MRIVFAGTPEVAVPSLRALHAAGHDIVRVITRPDAPVGRRRVLTPSPVAEEASRLGLTVLKASRLDGASDAAAGAELGVVVAYGGLVREPLLSAPGHGWVNLHFSLLPRWRGAAPVQHALIAGDTVTGASVFRLVPELDAGDVYAERQYGIGEAETAGEVLAALSGIGAELLRETVDRIAAGSANAVAQTGPVTLAPKLSGEDGRIDWSQPAEAVLNRFRGTTPEPGAHTTVDGARFKLHGMRAATPGDRLDPGETASSAHGVLAGTGTVPVLLERVQPAGKPPMAAEDWYRGLRGPARLGS